MGNRMEGDIAIEDIQKFVKESNQLGRNAIRQAYRWLLSKENSFLLRRWPNGEIPYTLSSQYGSYARSVIAKAMKVRNSEEKGKKLFFYRNIMTRLV